MNLARTTDYQMGALPTPSAPPIVFIVDDDVSVRESLELLVRHEKWKPETFPSAQEFLDPRKPVPSCLVLDLSLPGLNGLELQKRLAVEHIDMPIIFITGHGDVPKTVQAMKAGALEFLTKPLNNDVQVMALVVSGWLNKQVGGELGIREITVKAHRAQAMQKMKANSLAGLVKLAAELNSGANGKISPQLDPPAGGRKA